MEIKELLWQAKKGDMRAKEELFLQYRPLLLSQSMIEGHFNEDLYQELSITFLHCIEKFDIEKTEKRRK